MFDSATADRRHEFENVAMPHMGVLLRVAIRLCGERPSAEDLVQETFLRAWRSFEQFEAGTNCRAWLFKIMLNLAGKKKLQMRRRPQAVQLSPEVAEPVCSGALFAEDLRFTREEIFSAVDAMHEDHRCVLMLAVVEGFTCKEISGLLAIPIGTVMSRLSRARASLRNSLIDTERGVAPVLQHSC